MLIQVEGGVRLRSFRPDGQGRPGRAPVSVTAASVGATAVGGDGSAHPPGELGCAQTPRRRCPQQAAGSLKPGVHSAEGPPRPWGSPGAGPPRPSSQPASWKPSRGTAPERAACPAHSATAARSRQSQAVCGASSRHRPPPPPLSCCIFLPRTPQVGRRGVSPVARLPGAGLGLPVGSGSAQLSPGRPGSRSLQGARSGARAGASGSRGSASSHSGCGSARGGWVTG